MKLQNLRTFQSVTIVLLTIFGAPAATAEKGADIYSKICIVCHATGVQGAPKLGVEVDWRDRLKKGKETLVKNAIEGINEMPAKGGNPALTEQDIRGVVEYMLSQLGDPGQKEQLAARPGGKAEKARTKAAKETPKKLRRSSAGKVNAFNRLMKPPSQRNLPPTKDGIHDPKLDGTRLLQHPREAFAPLPKANSGNRVDWVAALERGEVNPRFSLEDETRAPVILDLNIVREVKGSMPDVVYPHKQHTEWLDCSNCHPSIFVPKKGANNISMASILLGEKCGVCHGKVAFPVSECRKCHSKNKPGETAKK